MCGVHAYRVVESDKWVGKGDGSLHLGLGNTIYEVTKFVSLF
jgi:hypothetical protein